jgi:predicted aldo/keto reductase-like oxidoreductase
MEYRKFGKQGWEVSALGFGAMRLPAPATDRSVDPIKGQIDEAESIRMMRYAFDHGVNYVDSAYMYCGGKSETVVGKALKDGYRKKVRVATKMPLHDIEKREDFDRIFNDQLAKLQTDYLDFYLCHGVNGRIWPKVRDLGIVDWGVKMKDEGKIRNFGFSFHDELPVLKQVLGDYPGWDFLQIQYNYMDTGSSPRSPGTLGLKYAASKGLPVNVMEPIRGGQLAIRPPAQIQEIWDESPTKRSPAEWALQWVWNQPEVSVVLSGMSTMQQVVENVESAERSGVNSLSRKELGIMNRVKRAYAKLGYIGCTGCLYCQPCPHGVVIPEIIKVLNRNYLGGHEEIAKDYVDSIAPENRADHCVQCGTCESKCPQGLAIMTLMRNANTAVRISEMQLERNRK